MIGGTLHAQESLPFCGQACNHEAGVSMSASSSCRPSWFRCSTAAQNIALPMTLAGTKPDRRWLDTVVDTVRVSPVTGGVASMGKEVRMLSSCRSWR